MFEATYRVRDTGEGTSYKEPVNHMAKNMCALAGTICVTDDVILYSKRLNVQWKEVD